MSRVFLGLGSNLQPQQHLTLALQKLQQQFTVVAQSPWYQSPARGFTGPDFINLVVELEFNGTLAELAQQLRELEYTCGRPENAQKYSSRTLDIDILLFDALNGEFNGIQLPRADICQYVYVLKPLLDIAPQLAHPATLEPLANYLPQMHNQPIELLKS